MEGEMSVSVVAGHNIKSFDLPFLIRSSVYNGVRIPHQCHPFGLRSRYYPNFYKDTMELIGAGEWGYRFSLDKFAKTLGIDGKNGSGKDFWKASRPDQEAYLENDLVMTKHCYNALDKAYDISESVTIFDMETRPRSIDEIMHIAGEFDESSVKVGNLKDPDKIAEKIENARESYEQDLIDKAGLKAEHAQPCAIGYIHEDGVIEMDFNDDPVPLLKRFWEVIESVAYQQAEEIRI
jgi:hypothetical protein